MMGGHVKAIAAAALLAGALAGCAGENRTAVTGAVLPPAAPRVPGPERSATADEARLAAAYGGEYRAPAMKALLSEMAARLVPHTEEPSQGYVVTIREVCSGRS